MNIKINTSAKNLRRIINEERRMQRLTGVNLTARDLISSLKQRGYVVSEAIIEDDDDEKDSLDSQVDRYLASFESDAKTTKAEGRDWRRTVQSLIGEAPEDEEEADEEGGEEPAEDAEPTPEEPQKLTTSDIDVESFANAIARLVDNYDSMLEIRSTLVRRAKTFLKKNYDEEVVDAVTDVLREQHGLVPGQTELEVEDEQFVAPRAGFAGPGGA